MLSYSLFFLVHSYHILFQPFLTLDIIARGLTWMITHTGFQNFLHISTQINENKFIQQIV